MSVYVDVDLLNLPKEMTDKRYSHEKHCDNKHCDNRHLARAYVPFQKTGKIYQPDESLIAGTVYPELNLPYKCKHEKNTRGKEL